MSDREEELLRDDALGNKTQSSAPGNTAAKPNAQQDLIDTFALFRTYMDGKMENLESKLLKEQAEMSKKLRENVSIKFRSEGNRIQYEFNEEIVDSLQKLQKQLPTTETKCVRLTIDALDKLKGRNKLIRIADSSPAGWSTVREYQANEIASDSDDEKKIRQAENRAMHTRKEKPKSRPAPYPAPRISQPVETYPNPAFANSFPRQPFRGSVARRESCTMDLCYFCKQFGHWRKNFENRCKLNSELFKGVKGRLANHIDYWETIGANQFVLDTLKGGYVIPFIVPPEKMKFRNNNSAFTHNEFVSESIKELVSSGCVLEVPFEPHIISPLSVAVQKSGKKRLILDLSRLNHFIKKEKIKFEDWKIAVQFFEKDTFMFKFDLSSGYFHIDICPQQHTYLGFSWNGKFYCFTVLVFGITTGPYIFTKCLRPLVKFWRENGIDVVLYLDDGFGMCKNEIQCGENSKFVKKSLISAGFLINEKKSVFEPVQIIEWLGIIWNSKSFSLHISDRRISELISSLEMSIKIFPIISARNLAQVVGKIISMCPVIGNVCRMMTKFSYMAIESRLNWDRLLIFECPVRVLSELEFWLKNVNELNCKKLQNYSVSHVVVYSDASNVAAGAYSVEFDKKIFHKMWNKEEALESSTWREMKAIELALQSFKHAFVGKTIKWYTDNQNCVRIVKSGSMKEKLHTIALSIFSICMHKCISVDIQWVPRDENCQADYISKITDYEDWGVSLEFFKFMNNLWGPYTLDRFANVDNHKVVRFNSLFWNPGSLAIDAFTQNWSYDNNWLVPPIKSVMICIKHLVFCRALGTLIVPKWKSSPYWTLIFKPNLEYHDYVKDVIEFKDPQGIYVKGTNVNCLFGSDKFNVPVLAVLLDARDITV